MAMMMAVPRQLLGKYGVEGSQDVTAIVDLYTSER